MAKKRKAKKQDSERWMVSYADLLTLMLAFFIVLYSQSMMNVSRLKEIAAGMIVAFHGNPNVINQQNSGSNGILKHHKSPVPTPVPRPHPAPVVPHVSKELMLRIRELDRAEHALRQVLAPMLSSHQVDLSRQPLSLRIRLNAKILYPSGQAQLTPTAQALLNQVSGVLLQLPDDFPIVIQGYTNKKPIHNAQFPSNWELSAMRAISVVHLFRSDGMPGKQLSAEGFSKFHPLKDDNSADALRVNRRVAILIKAPTSDIERSGVSLSQLSKMTGHDTASTNSTEKPTSGGENAGTAGKTASSAQQPAGSGKSHGNANAQRAKPGAGPQQTSAGKPSPKTSAAASETPHGGTRSTGTMAVFQHDKTLIPARATSIALDAAAASSYIALDTPTFTATWNSWKSPASGAGPSSSQ